MRARQPQALIAKKNAEREAAKRATKGGPTAKSSLILDIKPEDSETDMNELLGAVKQIEMEGLTWGGHEVRLTPPRDSHRSLQRCTSLTVCHTVAAAILFVYVSSSQSHSASRSCASL